MSEKSFNQPLKSEISLSEIIYFFLDTWRVIVGFSFLGLFGSLAYLAAAPNQYEARAQIRLAQVAINRPNDLNINPIGVNIEEPGALIARSYFPTFFSIKDTSECYVQGDGLLAKNFGGHLTLSSVKGTSSIVELKVRMSSEDQALRCAEVLFKKIKQSQFSIIEPYILEAKTLLLQYQKRLKDSQSIIARVDGSDNSFSAGYFATRDEIKFLTDETIRLSRFIASADIHQAQLNSPIYAYDVSISNKWALILAIGLLLGMSLGILFMLAKNFFVTYKSTIF